MNTINEENETIDTEAVATSVSPINGDDQPDMDNPENTILAESATLPTEFIAPEELDPLEGFDPDDYKDGVEGDERYRIIDLYLGYLCGKPYNYDTVKIRSKLVEWDEANRPPLGIMEIHAHIKANHAKWLHHHYLYKTGNWGGRI